MAKRNKGTPPTNEQSRILRREGYDPMLCEILQDYKASMIVLDHETNRLETIYKEAKKEAKQ